MKISNGDAYNLLVALNTVDQDARTKLSGTTRFAIALNINLLRPSMLAFERAREAARAPFAALAPLAQQAEISKADQPLFDEELEVDLRRFTKAELRLDDNERITGQMIASLAPIIIDFSDTKTE